eukprot:Pgem_evm1s4277
MLRSSKRTPIMEGITQINKKQESNSIDNDVHITTSLLMMKIIKSMERSLNTKGGLDQELT